MSAYEDEYVFEHITDPVESVQDYIPGGLHPVHLGDILGDSSYKILRKLGYGGYSTVWLAQDNRTSTLVALKITRADSDHSQEIQIQNVLRAKADQHPGSTSVMMLKDQFKILGPNGSHDCLVYEVLGPSIAHIRDEPINLNIIAYLTLSSVRKIVYQILLGLDYMHSIGVVHGDLYAANVLFTVGDLSQEPMELLSQPRDEISAEIKRVSGPQQLGDPRHLTLDRPLKKFISPKAEVKLSDLGNSFFEKNPPSKLETPAVIRSPEMIVDGYVSSAQDCWAFGCLIYNMLTNCYPFDLAFICSEEIRNDIHLVQLSALLGPLPSDLKERWPRYHSYFDEEGHLEHFDVEDDVDAEDTFSLAESENIPDSKCASTSSDAFQGELEQKVETPDTKCSVIHSEDSRDFKDLSPYPSILKYTQRQGPFLGYPEIKSLAEFHAYHPPLRKRWMAEKHPDIGPEESEAVLDLLQGIFVYDPEQRLSTKDLLQHTWIREYCAPSYENDESLEQEITEPRKKRKRPGTKEQLTEDREKSAN